MVGRHRIAIACAADGDGSVCARVCARVRAHACACVRVCARACFHAWCVCNIR